MRSYLNGISKEVIIKKKDKVEICVTLQHYMVKKEKEEKLTKNIEKE